MKPKAVRAGAWAALPVSVAPFVGPVDESCDRVGDARIFVCRADPVAVITPMDDLPFRGYRTDARRSVGVVASGEAVASTTGATTFGLTAGDEWLSWDDPDAE